MKSVWGRPCEDPRGGTTSRRNVYVNPLERAYVAIVHRRWSSKTFYMPTKG